MKKTTKSSVHLYVPILVFALVVGIIYFLFRNNKIVKNFTEDLPPQTTATPTEVIYQNQDWKTYTNTKEGYSFSYPNEVKITENKANDSIELSISLNGSLDLDYNYYFNSKIKTANLKDLSLWEYPLEWCKGLETTPCRDGVQNSIKDYNNNQIEGVKFKFMGDYVVYVFPNNNKSKYYEFQISSEEGGGGPPEAILQTVDQILSTFKFLSSEENSDNVSGLTCPESGWVDCMPGPNKDLSQKCSDEADAWYSASCPSYEGRAY